MLEGFQALIFLFRFFIKEKMKGMWILLKACICFVSWRVGTPLSVFSLPHQQLIHPRNTIRFNGNGINSRSHFRHRNVNSVAANIGFRHTNRPSESWTKHDQIWVPSPNMTLVPSFVGFGKMSSSNFSSTISWTSVTKVNSLLTNSMSSSPIAPVGER